MKVIHNVVAPVYNIESVFAYATLSGSINDAHNIHFPGATSRTLRISTSKPTSDSAILIRWLWNSMEKNDYIINWYAKNSYKLEIQIQVTQIAEKEVYLVKVKFWIVSFREPININPGQRPLLIHVVSFEYSPECICSNWKTKYNFIE